MRKFLFILCSFLLFCFSCKAELVNYSKSAILIEPTTLRVIYDYNSEEKLPPASMTKIMTLLLIMEDVDNGIINMDDMVTISSNAANMGGSQVFLQEGMQIKVSELIKSVAIASGNDAAVALAEFTSGSTSSFVDRMNQKVSDLGLSNTHFDNVHGLDSETHYSTAHDMAIIASNLIKHTKILEYTSLYEDYLNKPDGTKTWLVNTNKLVRYYDGIDGLKTGYTGNALYCLTATGVRNNIRLLSVVMGSDTSEHRSNDTISMLNYGFNNYRINKVVDKGQVIDNKIVYKGNIDNVDIITTDEVNDLIKVNEKKEYNYKIDINKLVAPVKYGDVIGSMEIIDNNGNSIKKIDLTVAQDINKQNLGNIFYKLFKKFVSGY